MPSFLEGHQAAVLAIAVIVIIALSALFFYSPWYAARRDRKRFREHAKSKTSRKGGPDT